MALPLADKHKHKSIGSSFAASRQQAATCRLPDWKASLGFFARPPRSSADLTRRQSKQFGAAIQFDGYYNWNELLGGTMQMAPGCRLQLTTMGPHTDTQTHRRTNTQTRRRADAQTQARAA